MSSEPPGSATIRGSVLIGAADVATVQVFRAVGPATGAALEPAFSAAGPAEVEAACALAAASPHASERPLATRARCLEAVADGIAELAAPLVARAMGETGLPRARPEDERAGTVEQLHLLADPVRSARRAGRVLANGWPTGVEVAPAMGHGGPFRATSDGRSSAVGPLAIERFLRPVCYRDLPDALPPPPLRPDDPWHLARRIDGALAPQPGR